jgi:antitoxin HicB
MAKAKLIDTHTFPTLDEYLDQRGLLDRVSIGAEKRAIARQLASEMKSLDLSKSEMAARMGTSRAQLDRVLNPTSQNVTVETLVRAAAVLGRRFHMELR